MSVLAAFIGSRSGPWGFGATLVAIAAAWAYSAEPVRLKRSGLVGAGSGRSQLRDTALVHRRRRSCGGAPSWPVIIVALLYGIGAHGIMTLNDFKALEGDRQMGVNSLPVTLGPERAAKLACVVMAIPQLVVFALLYFVWDRPWHGLVIADLADRATLRDEGPASGPQGQGALV
jgi:chlorophyll synthase